MSEPRGGRAARLQAPRWGPCAEGRDSRAQRGVVGRIFLVVSSWAVVCL